MTDTDNLSRRRFLKGTGAAATAAALAGCTGGGDGGTTTTTTTTTTSDNGDGGTTTTTTTPSYDVTKTVRSLEGTMDTLDPIKSTDTSSGGKIMNIFDALTNYPDGQTNTQMLLAKGVETSNGGKTLTFNLKEGVRFNNGTELTAQDFVYSFERLAASKNSRRAGFLLTTLGVTHEKKEIPDNDDKDSKPQKVYKPGSLGVKAVDDYTLEINLDGQFYAALSMLAYSAFSAVPEGIVGDIQGYEGKMDYKRFATKDPVGTGPYTLAKWQQSTEMKLKARDSYHAGKIKNAGIHYQIFNKTNPMYTYATVNVNADFPVIPSSKFQPKKVHIEGTDDRGRKYGTYGPLEPTGLTADYAEIATLSTYYNGFNCKKIPKPVRRATAWVHNQTLWSKQIFSGPDKAGYWFLPPALFPGGGDMYNQRAKNQYRYGYQRGPISKAKQIMEDAGYGPDNRFKMKYDMPSSSASGWGSDAFTLLRDKLTQAYIDLELRSASWSTYLNRGRQGKFEMFFLGWIADYPGLDNFLSLLYPPNTTTADGDYTSYFQWTEENGDHADEAKAAWEKIQNNYGIGEEQAQARDEAAWEMEKASMNDAVCIPLIHGISQSYKYQWVSKPRFGAMGGSRQKDHEIGIGDRGKYE